MQQALTEGYLSYRGRSSGLSKLRKKSAEVIVVVGNEPCLYRNNMEVSQSNEGPNVKSFQIP